MHQVIEIAKAFPGTPIKLQWTREEDQKHGFFHPTTMAKMRGSLDKDGNLTGLHMRISGQSIWRHCYRICSLMGRTSRLSRGDQGRSEPALDQHQISYDFPNLLVDHAMRNPPIDPVLAWREYQPERDLP